MTFMPNLFKIIQIWQGIAPYHSDVTLLSHVMLLAFQQAIPYVKEPRVRQQDRKSQYRYAKLTGDLCLRSPHQNKFCCGPYEECFSGKTVQRYDTGEWRCPIPALSGTIWHYLALLSYHPLHIYRGIQTPKSISRVRQKNIPLQSRSATRSQKSIPLR